MAFSIAIMSSLCLAQSSTNVTDITKEGSLLIWPKIVTTNGQDTYISISNSRGSSVNVKCYWEYKDKVGEAQYTYARGDCYHTDFQFRLTHNQPFVFSALTGEQIFDSDQPEIAAFGPDSEGILKCWAVNADATQQLALNYLKGEATIINLAANTAWEYNAYRFAANNASSGTAVGTAGTLNLSGSTSVASYDACPSYILFDFLAQGDNVSSDLTLIPCAENLKQEGSSTITKATFTIWNENEIKFTGAHQCFHCFIEWSLDKFGIPQDGGKLKPFLYSRLHTDSARMRVQGLASKLCPGSGTPGVDDTPLLGLLDAKFLNLDGKAYPDIAGTNASTAGKWSKNAVYIKWDPGYQSEEKAGR